MFTYIVMGLPFIGFVLLLDTYWLQTKVVLQRRTWQVMVVLMAMTLFFDQFLTGLPIVLYNESHMLGWRLGFAPIEDFTYTFAVVILVGALIKHGEKDNQK